MNDQGVSLETLKYLLGLFASAGTVFGYWMWGRMDRLEKRHDKLVEYVYTHSVTKEDATNMENRIVNYLKKIAGEK